MILDTRRFFDRKIDEIIILLSQKSRNRSITTLNHTMMVRIWDMTDIAHSVHPLAGCVLVANFSEKLCGCIKRWIDTKFFFLGHKKILFKLYWCIIISSVSASSWSKLIVWLWKVNNWNHCHLISIGGHIYFVSSIQSLYNRQ